MYIYTACSNATLNLGYVDRVFIQTFNFPILLFYFILIRALSLFSHGISRENGPSAHMVHTDIDTFICNFHFPAFYSFSIQVLTKYLLYVVIVSASSTFSGSLFHIITTCFSILPSQLKPLSSRLSAQERDYPSLYMLIILNVTNLVC